MRAYGLMIALEEVISTYVKTFLAQHGLQYKPKYFLENLTAYVHTFN